MLTTPAEFTRIDAEQDTAGVHLPLPTSDPFKLVEVNHGPHRAAV